MLGDVDDVRGDNFSLADCRVNGVLVGVVFNGDFVGDFVGVLDGDLFCLLVLMFSWDGLDNNLSL